MWHCSVPVHLLAAYCTHDHMLLVDISSRLKETGLLVSFFSCLMLNAGAVLVSLCILFVAHRRWK